MLFELHPSLARKIFLIDLPLCKVLLENELHYPWIILVPQRADVSRIMDLKLQDQLQLLSELDFAQKTLWEKFHPKQLNVASIGNKIPQLHLHVIARFENDPAWPQTVWDHPERKHYPQKQKEEMIASLTEAFEQFSKVRDYLTI